MIRLEDQFGDPIADEGARSMRAPADLSLVDHDGGLYRLDALLAELSPSEAAELEAAAPQTGQEA